MFGATIDYHILKPLTHRDAIATEEELDKLAFSSTFSPEDGSAYLAKVQAYFGNEIPVDPTKSYLDIGCGMGRLSIGLSRAGAKDVAGIEIIPRLVNEASKVAQQMGPDAPKFFCSDIHNWSSEKTYDVIFVLGAMEHIHDPAEFMKSMAKLLKPGGLAFVSHEPFQSPIGDHQHEYFRVQIPWRGMLFSEQAILRLRRECYRPTEGASKYDEIAGGLNLMSFSDYSRFIDQAGLSFVQNFYNPQIKMHSRYNKLEPINKFLTSIPKLRDYFIMVCYSILTKPA